MFLMTKYEEEIENMPVLSKFYGIVIRMVFIKPFAAHLHAIYNQSELIVRIAPLMIIQGDAPGRVRNMVLEWSSEIYDELLDAWTRIHEDMPTWNCTPSCI